MQSVAVKDYLYYAYKRWLPRRRIQVRGSCFAIRNIQGCSRAVYQGHVMHINVEWAPPSWTGRTRHVYYNTLRARRGQCQSSNVFFKMLVEQWWPGCPRSYGAEVPLHICKSRLCVRYTYEVRVIVERIQRRIEEANGTITIEEREPFPRQLFLTVTITHCRRYVVGRRCIRAYSKSMRYSRET